MEEPLDIVSSGPRWRLGRIAIVLVVLACLGVIASLALLVTHRNETITSLRTALDHARRPAAPVGAALSGSALFTLPDRALGSFSVVAVAVRPRPGSAPLTWLFVTGQHAGPGQRYGLLEGTCDGQFVTSSDLADGTADRNGDLTMTAPDLDISPLASDVWVMVYRWQDGKPLGGIQGPLVGVSARTFRTEPPCP